MTVLKKEHKLRKFLFGWLIYLGHFLILILVMLGMIPMFFSGSSFDVNIQIVLNDILIGLIFGAIVWVPLGMITGFLWMKFGSKQAFKFILFTDLGLIAALLVVRGSCQPQYELAGLDLS